MVRMLTLQAFKSHHSILVQKCSTSSHSLLVNSFSAICTRMGVCPKPGWSAFSSQPSAFVTALPIPGRQAPSWSPDVLLHGMSSKQGRNSVVRDAPSIHHGPEQQRGRLVAGSTSKTERAPNNQKAAEWLGGRRVLGSRAE